MKAKKKLKVKQLLDFTSKHFYPSVMVTKCICKTVFRYLVLRKNNFYSAKCPKCGLIVGIKKEGNSLQQIVIGNIPKKGKITSWIETW